MRHNRRNYYRLLHVQPDAPAEVIKASYRALMSIHHPDKGGDPEKAVLINAAYAVLSDTMKRAEYDGEREARMGKAAYRDARPADGGAAPGATNGAGPSGSQHHTSGASSNTYGAPKREGRGRECPMCALPVPTPMRRDARCTRCKAPLVPAGKPGGTNKNGERRTMPRVTKSDWALLYTSWHAEPIDVRMRDLSLDGISVYCGGALPDHSTVRIVGQAFDVVVDVVSSRRLANVFTLHARLVTAHFENLGGFVERTA